MSDPNAVIVIAYDFDGTLTPRPMQEYGLFPQFGIEAEPFWKKVNETAKMEHADPMIVYMRLLIDEVAARGGNLTRSLLEKTASTLQFHPGVNDWFTRINHYVREKSHGQINVRHCVISCGNAEIINACVLREEFDRVYASSYHYNSAGTADFPAVLITDAAKTQYLFRINKGREELTQSVNEHMPLNQRPIHFKQILYVGDGLTDVPCMAVTRQYGGHAVAVYDANNTHAQKVCRGLWEAGRADFDAPADYTEGSLLDQRIKLILDLKMANILMDLEHPSHPGIRG